MAAKFQVVGYLVPSHTERSFKVILKGELIGQIRTDCLAKALRSKPMLVVEISVFRDQPEQKSLDMREVTAMIKCDCGQDAVVWEGSRRECLGCYLKRMRGQK